MGLLLGLSHQAMAAGCDIEGGTTYQGCVFPKVLWHDDYGNYLDDKMSAAWSNYGHYMSEHPGSTYNVGLKTEPVTRTEFGWSGCSLETHTDNNVMNSDPNYVAGGSVDNLYQSVLAFGFNQATVSCGTYQKYSSGALEHVIAPRFACPHGYELTPGSTTSRVPPHGKACRPVYQDSGYNKPNSCRDFSIPGTGSFGNPVELGSRGKIDYAVDLKLSGPFPIVWDRYYTATGYRGWVFRSDMLGRYSSVSGVDYLSLRRADGSWLKFKAPSAAPGAHVWVPKETWSLMTALRTTVQDVVSGGALAGFELKTNEGLSEFFDLSGRLVEVVDPRGLSHHYSYDTLGRLEEISDDFGHTLSIDYMTDGEYAPYIVSWAGNSTAGYPGGSINTSMISSWSDYYKSTYLVKSVTDGVRTVEYDYQTVGGGPTPYLHLLSAVQAADGTVRQYKYGETVDGKIHPPSWMTGLIDETGNRTSSYKYGGSSYAMIEKEWRHTDTAGERVEEYTSGGGGWIDPMGNVFAIGRNSLGQITTMSKDCGAWCQAQIPGRIITYSSWLPVSIYDFNNNRTTMAYDGNGLPSSRTEAYNTPLARTATWTWDATLRKPLTKTEPTVVGGTPHTRTTTWTYNTAGSPLTETVSASSGEPSRVETRTYNGDGLLETLTDPRGAVTRWTYHPSGEVASITEADGTALARTTTLGGYTVSGQPGWVTEPSGLTTRITWDPRDRPTLIEVGIPGSGGPTGTGGTWEATALTYAPIGKVSSITRPDGTRLEFSYSRAHRLVQARQLSADPTPALLGQIDYTLNAAGQVSVETLSANGVTLRTSSKTYDDLARVDKLIGALSQETDLQTDPQGNDTGVVDPLSHARTRQYDALNRVVKEIDALLGESTYAYDPQDNLVSATDARGVQTGYVYNAFNELLSTVSPDRGTWAYTYDAGGNPVTVSDPRGVVATATYDALGRPLTLTYDASLVPSGAPGFVAGVRNVTWAWDSCTNGVGQLCSRADWSGVTGYSYDAWGRLTGESFIPAGQTAPLANGYGYDSFGRLDARVYPSGKTLVFTYGSDGRVSGIAWAGSAVVEDIAWQPFDGPVLGWQWSASGIPPTKSTVAFTYDLDGRMSHISDIDEIDLVHDLGDRLTGVAHQAEPTLDQVHDYDAEDRLIETDRSTWPAPLLYTWDAVGNRETRLQAGNGWQNAYGLADSRLASVSSVVGGVAGSPVSRTFDAMGNTINDGAGKTYGYDAAGRLVSFSGGGSGASFVVGSNGLRSRKTVTGIGAGDRLYTYDDQRRLVGVYIPDGSGGFTVSEELVYLPDSWRILGTVRGQVAGGAAGTFYPVLSDQIETPRVVLDPASGDRRWTWQGKEVFGDTAPNENPDALGVFRFDARFPGQWFDPETGLFHNGFRDYDPETGRYVQSDPIGLGVDGTPMCMWRVILLG